MNRFLDQIEEGYAMRTLNDLDLAENLYNKFEHCGADINAFLEYLLSNDQSE